MLPVSIFASLAPLAALCRLGDARPVVPSHHNTTTRHSTGAPRSHQLQHPFGLPVVTQPHAQAVHLPSPDDKKKPAIDRDFERFPTVLNYPTMEHDVWFVGDVHGDYGRYTRLLQANGLIAPSHKRDAPNPFAPLSPTCDTTPSYRWAGQQATLIQTGDVIDKGYWNARLLHLHMTLDVQAKQAGGRFIMTMGNHELALNKQAINAKTTGPGGIALELWGCEVDPDAFAAGHHPMGRYLNNLPILARVGPFAACHGGQTSTRSLDGMDVRWRLGLERDGYATQTLNGINSVLRARDFAGRDGQQGPDLVRALDPDVRHPVLHIVHGHNPEVGEPGEITAYGFNKHKIPTLIDIDVGMTHLENYSQGWLLHASLRGNTLTAEACDHKAKCDTVWTEELASD